MVKLNGGQWAAIGKEMQAIGGGTNVEVSQGPGGRGVRAIFRRNVGGPSQTFGPYIVRSDGRIDRSAA